MGGAAVTMPSYKAWGIWLSLSILPWGLPAPVKAQSQQQPPPTAQAAERGPPAAPGTFASPQPLEQPLPGSISGTVVDRTGAFIVGARVSISRQMQSPKYQEALSGDNGQFSFTDIAPGPFQLTIA